MAEAVVSELAKTAIGLFFDIVDVLISLLPSAPFRIMLSQLSEDSMSTISYRSNFARPVSMPGLPVYWLIMFTST